MNYRTLQDLNSAVNSLAHELSDDFDLIVGIPRSGLLVANLLALQLNKPLSDIDRLLEGTVIGSGKRLEANANFQDFNRVLVVDDSVYSGDQLAQTRSRIESQRFPFDIEYASIYITPQCYNIVDHWHEVLDPPRVFEWNIMHHEHLSNMCVDIDGVLCRDPSDGENDDGENYIEFLTTVEPKITPTKEIGWLVTCRLEKYRDQTENWLDTHGIEYQNLVMMDLPDMETRKRQGNHARFKSEVYRETGADLFIESSPYQAADIAKLSGKPVLDFESNQIITPDLIPATIQKTGAVKKGFATYLKEFLKDPVSFPGRFYKFVKKRLVRMKDKLYLRLKY